MSARGWRSACPLSASLVLTLTSSRLPSLVCWVIYCFGGDWRIAPGSPVAATVTIQEDMEMTTKYPGFALMVGVVLIFVGSLFLPGNSIINPVDQIDYPEAVDALRDSAVLAQWMTFITLISLLLMSFGLLALFPLASRQPGLGGRLLQFGIITSIIEWSVLIVASGMRHFSIHLTQRADLGNYGSLTEQAFMDAALAVHIDMLAVTLTFVVLFPLASILVGLGLAPRFGSMGVYKIASYLLVLVGLVGLLNFLISINSPDVGIDLLLYVNSVVLYIGGACLFIMGLGMYRGQPELSEQEASG